jgi:hypothetical protein
MLTRSPPSGSAPPGASAGAVVGERIAVTAGDPNQVDDKLRELFAITGS